MPQCQLYKICGLDAEGDSNEGRCILHSRAPAKNSKSFADALKEHRKQKGDHFEKFVFPAYWYDEAYGLMFSSANFREATFCEDACFRLAEFNGLTDFTKTTFTKDAVFSGARFEQINFQDTIFGQNAYFFRTEFRRAADFSYSTFNKAASFRGAKFSSEARFVKIRFQSGADFAEVRFNKGRPEDIFNLGTSVLTPQVSFHGSEFLGKTIFSSGSQKPGDPSVFYDATVDFRDVTFVPLDVATFRDADFRKCEFIDTDLREVEMAGVWWPRIRGRLAVYDEIKLPNSANYARFFRMERLYRQLKQNYQQRGDHERVGDFHYGGKNMRRKSPHTAVALRFFLTLYWLFSGYGERYLRPLISAAILLIASTFFYLKLGLHPKDDLARLSLTSMSDWLRASHYSFRVMTFLKPEDLIPSESAKWVNTVQSIFGPILLGLFALALRQRLKR